MESKLVITVVVNDITRRNVSVCFEINLIHYIHFAGFI